MYKIFVLLFSASGLLYSCSTDKPAKDTITPDTLTTGQPVETKNPNSDYKPEFIGQTRIGSVKTTTEYEGRVITTSLDRPWGIAVLPDGRLLITEKGGSMRIATTAGQLSPAITGIPAVNQAGQGGHLGVVIDPQFETNKMIFWVFSESTASGNLTSVAKGKLSADERRIENATVIYRAAPAYGGTLHYGGRILIDKAGNLIVSTGERSDLETRVQAQELNSALGKIVKITKDGQPAPGNPFSGQAGAKPELYSYGHRNVQGLAIHPQTGDVWESEMGPRGGDEINLVHPGKNYGWPSIGYGIEYGGNKIGSGATQKSGMEQPVYYWDPVISPSGITFFYGNSIPEWTDNLFVCGLSGNHIARLVIKDNKVVGEERLLSSEGQRFRDIVQGKDAALYAVTDQGRLYRVGRKM